MKRKLLVFSLIFSFIITSSIFVRLKASDESIETKRCNDPNKSIVRILDEYGMFISNGIVYKVDENYNYIISSIDINKPYKVLYENGKQRNAALVGKDDYNDISILKTDKENDIEAVCFADSNYLYKGQQNYAYGYYDISNSFYIKTTLSQIGDLYKKEGYVHIYKSIVDITGDNQLKGTGIFDDLNRLIGIVSAHDDSFKDGSFITESNKLLKIADSIVKTGKYNVNYIKYSIEDYSSLSSFLKESYGINKSVEYGVVITSFKPLDYLFGTLSQGMVIVAVNGLEIKNKYELDKQLERYSKNDNVCLKVIKKNGKEAFYHVDI